MYMDLHQRKRNEREKNESKNKDYGHFECEMLVDSKWPLAWLN